MSNLSTKVKLYLETNSKTWDDTKVSLQNDSDGNGDYIKSWTYDIAQPTADQIASYETAGNGVFIASWTYDGLAEPTADQIASYETAGNTAEALSGVLAKRANEYPELKEQLDMQYKDLLNGTTTWKDAIAKVKSDNPKS